MEHEIIPKIIFVLYIVGLGFAAASYLSYKNVISKSYCEIGEEFRCNEIYSLPPKYSGIFGVHFSVLAPLYFSIMTALSLGYIIGGRKPIEYLLIAGGLLGLAFVPYLVYIEARIARAFCLYCTIMHAIIVANTVLSLFNMRS